MSSHHIVREKQEPALLVLGLDNFDDEQLGQLLEWSPTVLATSLAAEQLNTMGIKIDWVIAEEEDSDLQSDLKYLPSGNDTVTAAALKHLVGQGYPSVNIVTDDFDINNYQPFVDDISLVIFHRQQKIYSIAPGFSKWKPGNDEIRLLSSPKNLKTSGLTPTGNLSYKTATDGFFTVDFDDKHLFIAEAL